MPASRDTPLRSHLMVWAGAPRAWAEALTCDPALTVACWGVPRAMGCSPVSPDKLARSLTACSLWLFWGQTPPKWLSSPRLPRGVPARPLPGRRWSSSGSELGVDRLWVQLHPGGG